ncbi:hypothetical protein EP331_02855 [bacterium]|nr:MAG: hypothetical protein EP331_02855 [bacterium]
MYETQSVFFFACKLPHECNNPKTHIMHREYLQVQN